MTTLSGSLQGFGLVPILRLLADARSSGRLHLSQDGWSGEVFLRDGQAVAAWFGVARGLGAAPSSLLNGLNALEATVVTLPNATFFFTDSASSPDRNIALETQELQARLATVAEQQQISGVQVVSLVAVPYRVDLSETQLPDDELKIDRGKLHLLLAIDGQRTVADLIGEQHDLLHTFRDLGWLVSRGLVDVKEGAQDASRDTQVRMATSSR